MKHGKIISISHHTPDIWEGFAVNVFSKVWREDGLDVRTGLEYASEADVCILHHDRTYLDRDTLPEAPDNVPILNGAVLDISKKSYSSLRVTEDDAWAGPVIVKSNLNHFGVPEADGAKNDLLTRLRRRLARHSWRAARMLPERHYPVLQSMNDVPGWVWNNPDLIVERFLPERTGDGLYGVRGWVFFGDQGYAYRNLGTDPLVKVKTTVRNETLGAAPQALQDMRKRLGFDFGKFDYVEHDGEVFLLDANKTPTFPTPKTDISPRVRTLAKGIEAYL